MDKEEFINRVNNPNHIPGIYNYCDRWCERCGFTSKCANYSITDTQFSDENMDLKNEKFWDKLSEIFQITMEMILEKVEELGVDPNDFDTDEFEKEEEKVKIIASENKCSILSNNYYKIVNVWFEKSKLRFDEKNQEWEVKQRLGLPIEDHVEINDVFEIIKWYQYQIHVKTVRALKSKINEEEDPQLWEEFPKDSEGSAKVALIGIDRSISSWGKMLNHFPLMEDETLLILINLQKLQRFVEEEFPNARGFKRIGFDD